MGSIPDYSSMEATSYLKPMLEKAAQGGEKARIMVMTAARQLFESLETPLERAWRTGYENTVIFAGHQLFIDLGIFEAWYKAGGGVKTCAEIVKLANTSVDENVLRRFLRLLAATNVITEVGEDQYKPTTYSMALGNKETLIDTWIQCGTDHMWPSTLHLPRHLKETGYKEPVDAVNSAYAGAFPEHQTFFERCQAKPEYYASFNGIMQSWTLAKTPWPEYFDTQAALLEGADLAGPLLVDVGGNVGHDTAAFLRKNPDVPAGSLVVQDLPEVTATAKVDEKIKMMPHDFWQEQPVKGSRAYFCHAVFHDWPRADSLKLLGRIRAAMRPGYSKLLICDIVIPARGASALQTAMDTSMMAVLDSRERTRADWDDLLAEAGFAVRRVWPDPRGYESVIEAELTGDAK
ncbi:S-adenosyl-L-methionine-dependent methyltransferase [Xylariaceae sp. FL0804]|nr:S-adenosyl-L-methionine-dependent methyltransferase [Xylariaceae sp. FL0804]